MRLLVEERQTNDARCWLLGSSALDTLRTLTDSFREVARKQIPQGHGFSDSGYLPWMDSFSDHGSSRLLQAHKVRKSLLIDQEILNEIESAFIRDGNPLGLILQEEKSFRILKDVSEASENFNRYGAGFETFLSSNNYWRELFDVLCTFVVPIYSTRETIRDGGVGFSTLRARGAIFLSLPNNLEHSGLELAINLSHELGHQALMIYQGADRILADELDKPVYSVIRRTMRPAIWSFHAVVATAFMLMFVSDLRKQNELSPEEQTYLKHRQEELRNALVSGVRTCAQLNFTEIGWKLFYECEQLSNNFKEVCLEPR